MRAFVAVEVAGPGVADSLARFQERFAGKARATDPHNLHFTLIFLGEITERQAEQVGDFLESVSFEPFEVELVGAGAFPGSGTPRVIWIGTDPRGGAELAFLAETVRGGLASLGFRGDRPFAPHVTVLRVRGRIGGVSESLAEYRGTWFGTCIVHEIKFKRSVLTPSGPVYSDLRVVGARE